MDSMVQNYLLVDSFENEKGLLSKLIPYKILETILCKNFTKKIVFLGSFCSPFSSKVLNCLKTFTILNRIYLRSFLDIVGHPSLAHPFYVSGAPIKAISPDVKYYDNLW